MSESPFMQLSMMAMNTSAFACTSRRAKSPMVPDMSMTLMHESCPGPNCGSDASNRSPSSQYSSCQSMKCHSGAFGSSQT